MAVIEKVYDNMHAASREVLQRSFEADVDGALGRAHCFAEDYERCLKLAAGRPEQGIFKHALREYQFSLLALVQGHYRHAHMALRLFFELSLLGVYLSAKEVDLRLWLIGDRDHTWSEIINDENGVFSLKFFSAFSGVCVDERKYFLSISQKIYRECSEFVHGNFASGEAIPGTLSFSQQTMDGWIDKAASVRMVVLFAMLVRYGASADKSLLRELKDALSDNLGHLQGVRLTFL